MNEYIYREEFPVVSGDFASAGSVSSRIKQKLKQAGVANQIIREAAISAYELEMNLVIHSLGGEMVVELSPAQLRLISSDRGPGIDDLTLAMKEGYSTAPESVRDMGFGAGMGLPNVKRHCNVFAIQSEKGKGTYITADYDL